MAGNEGSQPRLAGLDGLRAIAAMGVVMVHGSGLPGFPEVPWLHAIVERWGGLCVPLFFVLSGFLITRLMLSEARATGTISLRDFYLRRALRILPAGFVYLAVVSVLAAFVSAMTVKPIEVWAAVFWFRNILYGGWAAWAMKLGDGIFYTAHFWSLSVEEHFYFIWPLGFRVMGARRLWFIAALVVLTPVWRAWNMKWSGAGGMNYWRTDLIADFLAGGALLAVMRDRFGTTPGWARFANWATPLAMALAVGWGVARQYGPTTGPVWQVLVTLEASTMMLGLVALVGWASRGGTSWPHRVLNSRPLVWIGAISYSLYLWQQLFSGRQLPPAIQSFPVNLVLAFGAATASYHLVERPFLRLRSKFRRHAPPEAAAM